MTVKESWCTPVCELVACVDPELQAGADRLYYCTIHPKHHTVAKVDLSQTQIQWRTYSQEHVLQSHNPSVLVHPGMQPKEMASFLSSTVPTIYVNFHPAHIFPINNTPQQWILWWQIVWNIHPTTYDNIEGTKELIPNVLQLKQWFHKFTNLHPQAQKKPVNRDDIYYYAYWSKVSSWCWLSKLFLFTNPSCRKCLEVCVFSNKMIYYKLRKNLFTFHFRWYTFNTEFEGIQKYANPGEVEVLQDTF